MGKMAKGTGSGKGRSKIRLFDGTSREEVFGIVYRDNEISVDEYRQSGEKMKRYCARIKFNQAMVDIFKDVVSENHGRRNATGYDIFLRRCSDRSVAVCVDLNNELRESGIKNCEKICKSFIDLVYNRHSEQISKRKDDRSCDISDKLEQVKVLITEIIRNDAKSDKMRRMTKDIITNHVKRLYAEISNDENEV